MWKFILFSLILYIAYRLLRNDLLRRMRKNQSTPKPPIEEREMVQDPTCGTYIIKNSEYTVNKENTLYHFCSIDCKNAFLEKE